MKKSDMIKSNKERVNTTGDDCEDLFCVDCGNKFTYDNLLDLHSFGDNEEGSYNCIDCDTINYLNNK